MAAKPDTIVRKAKTAPPALRMRGTTPVAKIWKAAPQQDDAQIFFPKRKDRALGAEQAQDVPREGEAGGHGGADKQQKPQRRAHEPRGGEPVYAAADGPEHGPAHPDPGAERLDEGDDGGRRR